MDDKLALRPGELTDEQVEILTGTVCKGASRTELAAFLEVCRGKQLDPFSGQIHALKRWTRDHGNVWTYQVGIDGFRAIADRTGERDGVDGPYWCGPDGGWVDVWLASKPPAAAKVTVYRQGHSHPYPAIALWDFYAQRKKDGSLTAMWAKGGPHMLAKCAEALALRMAFPEHLGGLYSSEEMQQAQEYQPPLAADFVEAEVAEVGEVEAEAEVGALLDSIFAADSRRALQEVALRCRGLIGDDRETALAAWKKRSREIANEP